MYKLEVRIIDQEGKEFVVHTLINSHRTILEQYGMKRNFRHTTLADCNQIQVTWEVSEVVNLEKLENQ